MVTYCATKLTATCSPMIGQFFFHIFIYTAKVVTNTVHNSNYIHLLTMRHVTEFAFIAGMQMLNVTLLT